MTKIIENRTELLFLYDIENANPNGDPLNENRPRFDHEDSTAIVSDVRLKRTIRDYWFEYKGHNGQADKDIFVRETKTVEKDNEYINDGKTRSDHFKLDKKKTSKAEHRDYILQRCIDIRVFGGVLPLAKDSITFTGPVQFQMGRSLNRTGIVEEMGTGAFASGKKKLQATLRTEYKLPYAVIGFNGIINEKAAAYSKMTEQDREELLDGMWNGTKSLISRSKFGQQPLLLLCIEYKEPFYIGNLRQRLRLVSEAEDKIRSASDYQLEMGAIVEQLNRYSDKIKSVTLRLDSRLTCLENGEVLQANGMEIITV